jgi:hypothetical protein
METIENKKHSLKLKVEKSLIDFLRKAEIKGINENLYFGKKRVEYIVKGERCFFYANDTPVDVLETGVFLGFSKALNSKTLQVEITPNNQSVSPRKNYLYTVENSQLKSPIEVV